MTYNQIQFHNALETERHNKMMEAETNRHQLATEQLQSQANELQRMANAINQAHYERMDALSSQNLLESQRANLVNEQIKQRSNAIQASSVAETSRHQKAQESITKSLNESLISKNLAQVSEIGANTGYIQARTKTEGWNTNLAIADIGLKHAQESLIGEQTQTEYTRRFANTMSGFQSGANAISTVFKTLIPVVTSGAGGGAPDFWTQIEAMY